MPRVKAIKSNLKEIRMGANTKFNLSGGLCVGTEEAEITYNQSPDCLNVMAEKIGGIQSRQGQSYVYPTSLGASGIYSIYPKYQTYTMIHYGAKLYKQSGSTNPVEVGTLANHQSIMFVFNGLLYILDGTKFWNYDGATLTEVTPYVPTITNSRKPDGSSSTLYENLNLLSDGFIDSFTGDGSSTVYHLSYVPVTSVVAVKLNGVLQTLGTHYSVNLTDGTVTFVTAPPTAPNNVTIECTKTGLKSPSDILNCTIAIEFSSRMWLSGNSSRPTVLWRSGLTDLNKCNYFPALDFSTFGNDGTAITGFANQYDKLVIFKETTVWYSYSEFDNNNVLVFPYKLINNEIGCDCPGSIQLINNNPTFVNSTQGMFTIVSTNIFGEKNVLPISYNINDDLLTETGIKLGCSFDFKQKYYYSLPSGKTYVWNYANSYTLNVPAKLSFWKYDNIKAKQFFNIDSTLMYAHNNIGHLVKFIESKSDFGSAINIYWKTKLIDFDFSDMYKKIMDLRLTIAPNCNSLVNIEYYTDKKTKIDSQTIDMSKSFDWSRFKWDEFTWSVNRFPITHRHKIRLNKVIYFQILFSTNTNLQYLDLYNIIINYKLLKKIKR